MSMTMALIPARMGSKRLPGKNIMPFAGRPLIEWSILAALEARCIHNVFVSTDSAEIAEVARSAGAAVPFLRPPSLATDMARTTDVLHHTISSIPGYSHFVLLQPTSPLRTAQDIDDAFETMLLNDRTSCVSVTPMKETPQLIFYSDKNNSLKTLAAADVKSDTHLVRLNGAIYISDTIIFQHTGALVRDDTIPYTMPSDKSIDIDTKDDFERAERLFMFGARGR